MTMIQYGVTDTSLDPAAALFRALGEPARLTILRHLFTGEHKVRELTDHLGLAQSTVSAHLTCLRECGLVVVRPDGRSSIYRLADPDGLRETLRAAEQLLSATGSAVVLCPHIPEAEAAS